MVLSDHGQTQGATFKQRNGYSLEDLVARSLESASVTGIAGGDEQSTMAALALGEATGMQAKPEKKSKTTWRTARQSCSARATSASST